MKRADPRNPGTYSPPERILIVLARYPGDCRGKAVRFRDGAECRFENLDELAAWLAEDPRESLSRDGEPGASGEGES